MKKNLYFSIIGVILNTLFPVVVFRYVSRVLGSEGIGIYNYYNIGISYLALIANFGISIYGVKEIGKYKDDIIKKSQIVIELITIMIINSIICYIFLLIMVSFTHYKSDSGIILILGITLLTNALSSEWFFVAIENQKYLFIRNLLLKFISLAAIFVFIKSKNDLLTYSIILVAGFIVTAILNILNLLKIIKISVVKKLCLTKYFKSLLLIFLVEISVRYFGMGDVIILGNYITKQSIGYYTLALSVFMIITSLLKISTMTLLPRSSYYLEKTDYLKFNILFRNSVDLIIFLGVPCSFGLILWAENIVNILGGPSFAPSVLILQYFASLIIISALINLLVFQILYPLNKIKSILISYVSGIVVNIIFNIILIPTFSYTGTLIASLISNIFICVMLFVLEHKYINCNMFSKNVIKYLIAGILMIFSSMIMGKITSNAQLLINVVYSCLIYLVLIILQKDEIVTNILLQRVRKYEKS